MAQAVSQLLKEHTSLPAALAQAQSEMSHAKMDNTNPHFRSRFASLGSVIDAVKGPLNANGISFVQRSVPSDGGVSVETVFYGHGQTIETGPVFVPADRGNAHGYGSALTYAKRYSLAMACGIAAEEDDDGNQAVETKKKGQSVTKTVIEMEGIEVDEKVRDAYVEDIVRFIAEGDEDSLTEVLAELSGDSDMKICVWSLLDSKARSHITKREKRKS